MWYGGDGVYTATITLQNSGHFPWTYGGSTHWFLSYRWRKGDNVQESNQPVELPPNTVSEGDHRTVTITVHDPPNWGSGEYILEFDMFYKLTASGNVIWFSNGQSLPWFTFDVDTSPLICIQSNCQKEHFYLPLVFKNPAAPPPPTGECYAGRVLIEDDFENGDPFSGSGTGTDGPWTRVGLEGFPAPVKVSLDDHGRSDDDGLRFGGHDNQSPPADQTDDFDQAIYQTIPIYAGTKTVKVFFDLLMESDQPTSFPGSYDHFYWGMQTTLDQDNLNEKYECNEDRCSPWGQGNNTRWDRYWFTTELFVEVEPAWRQNGQVYVGFWVNVNQDWATKFYMDNFKVEIETCE
jgi:hypothetical protein